MTFERILLWMWHHNLKIETFSFVLGIDFRFLCLFDKKNSEYDAEKIYVIAFSKHATELKLLFRGYAVFNSLMLFLESVLHKRE